MHPTHYGRICPVETPEGPNIGLINSLATFARVNEFGFIESPYRKVVDDGGTRRVSGEVEYLTAMQGTPAHHRAGQCSADRRRRFCRRTGVLPTEWRVRHGDGRQGRHDGCLAQAARFGCRGAHSIPRKRRRQPRPDGIQHAAPGGAPDPRRGASGGHRAGRSGGAGFDLDPSWRAVAAWSTRSMPSASWYGSARTRRRTRLASTSTAFPSFSVPTRTPASCNAPLVKVGQDVARGDILGDGPSTDRGELALGRNVLCAFMPWNGYNFEDSILISERVVRDDVFTSIHIEEFEVMSRDTKLGPEEITRDIPNAGEGGAEEPGRGRHRLYRRRGRGRRHPGRQDYAQGRNPDDTGREVAARNLRGEGVGRARHFAAGAAGRSRHGGRGSRVFARRASRRTSARAPSSVTRVDRLKQDRDDERTIIERNIFSTLRGLLDGKEVTKGPGGVCQGRQRVRRASRIPVTRPVVADRGR